MGNAFLLSYFRKDGDVMPNYKSSDEKTKQAFEMIEQICIQKISLGENELDILCVYDSIASTPTKDEKERAMDDKEMASQAKIITRSLRKIRGSVQKANMGVIFINQSRINMDMSGRPTHGDKYTMPGGQACKHFCDVLIRMAKSKQDSDGQFIKMSVPSKNRLFKPKQAIEIYFNYTLFKVPVNLIFTLFLFIFMLQL